MNLTKDLTATRIPAARLITIIIASIIGVAASTILLFEKIELWKNPDYIPSCSWNPLFSCQGPMMSWQASAIFGIPYPLIGAVGFTLAGVIAVILATSHTPAWLRLAWWIGNGAALVYVFWLMTQSLFVIEALCIYCMVIWAVTIILFWASTATWADNLPGDQPEPWWGSWVPLTLATLAGVITLILVTFRDFFFDFLL